MSRPASGLRFLDDAAPWPFCPGCSHGIVADALGLALERHRDDASRVVLVSDIGCVGLVDRHFRAHTFHGLHGRSLTYATGLALARPDLHLFVVLGDGACGIGGHHLVQAARRGLPMTVLVFDNFNYGMTGGQQSTTTPAGAVTSSSPDGAVERPLDICALAAAAGATFVARAAAFDPEMPSVVARAAAHPGFALVDVWEFCTAHFAPSNRFRKAEMLDAARSLGMEFGVLRDAAPPQRRVRAPEPPPSAVALGTEFSHDAAAPRSVLVAGSAGQKIKSAALALGRAAVRSGLHATQKDDYPITVRTGHSVSEVIVSPRPVGFTGVESPDLAIVLTPEGAVRARPLLAAMRPDGLVLADASIDGLATPARIVREDFRAAARTFGETHVALHALARLLTHVAVVPPRAFRDTVERFTSAAYREAAVRAASADGQAGAPSGR